MTVRNVNRFKQDQNDKLMEESFMKHRRHLAYKVPELPAEGKLQWRIDHFLCSHVPLHTCSAVAGIPACTDLYLTQYFFGKEN